MVICNDCRGGKTSYPIGNIICGLYDKRPICQFLQFLHILQQVNDRSTRLCFISSCPANSLMQSLTLLQINCYGWISTHAVSEIGFHHPNLLKKKTGSGTPMAIISIWTLWPVQQVVQEKLGSLHECVYDELNVNSLLIIYARWFSELLCLNYLTTITIFPW